MGPCGRCIRIKTKKKPKLELANIVTDLKLILIDVLSLEKSKGNIEDISVIKDIFTKYAIAIPKGNQKSFYHQRNNCIKCLSSTMVLLRASIWARKEILKFD